MRVIRLDYKSPSKPAVTTNHPTSYVANTGNAVNVVYVDGVPLRLTGDAEEVERTLVLAMQGLPAPVKQEVQKEQQESAAPVPAASKEQTSIEPVIIPSTVSQSSKRNIIRG